MLRSREHTDLLIDELDADILWQEFGIVSDIVVSLSKFQSLHVCIVVPLGVSFDYFSGRALTRFADTRFYSLLQTTSRGPIYVASYPPTFYINSSRARSRITSSTGSKNTWS